MFQADLSSDLKEKTNSDLQEDAELIIPLITSLIRVSLCNICQQIDDVASIRLKEDEGASSTRSGKRHLYFDASRYKKM